MGDVLPSSVRTPLRGSTLPRLWTRPLARGLAGPCGCGCALSPATSLGFSAVQFAEDVLGFTLIPWQRWLLIHALETLPDGRFRFRTVLVLVARQNGKTTLVEVKNLWKMFVLRVPLVIGTAQNLDVAEESWNKAVEIVEGTPDLAAEIQHVDKTNGKKALCLVGGSRWKVAAASRRGGRGFAADDVNLDELREHQTWDSWAAVTKTTMARRKAQVWAFSNAGDDKSLVLNSIQDKARLTAGDDIAPDGSVGLFEWSAPDDCDIDDPAFLAMANPSLGYTITEESLQAARETDPEPVFRTECLCQRVPDLEPSKIPLAAWLRCTDKNSQIVGRMALAWEVSWDRTRAAIAVAGPREDGLTHVEVIDCGEGTEWVAPRLAELVQRHDVGVVAVDPSGPAGALLVEVTAVVAAWLEPKLMTARDMAHACGQLYDATTAGRIRHLGDDRLTEALRHSAVRTLADAWAWDRKHATGDVTPLGAVTAAVWGLASMPPPPVVDVWGFWS